MMRFINTHKVLTFSILALVLCFTVLPLTGATPFSDLGSITFAADQQQDTPSCSVWDGSFFINIFSCGWLSITSVIAVTLTTIASFFLYVAGTLFDAVVSLGVSDFNTTYSAIQSGLEIAWQALRDFANIGLIGAFVFVAVATILNIQQYGIEKFLARLIIVAILINFSLFLTKTVFDVSNYTAHIFIQSMPAATAANTLLTNDPTATASSGIATEFLTVMGISGSFDFSSFWNGGTAGGQISGNTVLIQGVAMSIFLILAAVVLMYAAFLLIARAVAIIFILMSSSLAFAAAALPGMGSFWEMWKNQLIKSALFAPLLMMFLWAVLRISQALAGNNPGGLLSQLADPANNVGSIQTIFNYGIIIGLLIAAIKTANSFAEYAAPALLSKRALGAANFTTRIGRGLPSNAGNIYSYLRSRRSDYLARDPNRLSQAARPNAFGLQSLGLKLGVLSKRGVLDRNKARLEREAQGKVGPQYSPEVQKAKDIYGEIKQAVTAGAPKGGAEAARIQAEKEAKEKEKGAQKKELDAIRKEATLSADEQKQMFTQVGKDIGAQLKAAADESNKSQQSTFKEAFSNAYEKHNTEQRKLENIKMQSQQATNAQEKSRIQQELRTQQKRTEEARTRMDKERSEMLKQHPDILDELQKNPQKYHEKAFEEKTGKESAIRRNDAINKKYDDEFTRYQVKQTFNKESKDKRLKDFIANFDTNQQPSQQPPQQNQPQNPTGGQNNQSSS